MKRIMLIAVLASAVFHASMAQTIDLRSTAELSPYVFGHNLEHTRAAVNGGLSAQMLRNRKFAGKPSKNQGVAGMWEGIGDKVLFQNGGPAYTKHIGNPEMRRSNELYSQSIQNLVEGQTAGISQDGLFLKKGEAYQMRAVTRVFEPLTLTVELTDRDGAKVYATKTLELRPTDDWVVSEFEMVPAAGDRHGRIRYTFDKGGASHRRPVNDAERQFPRYEERRGGQPESDLSEAFALARRQFRWRIQVEGRAPASGPERAPAGSHGD